MPGILDLPLELYEVLEEEYLSLHGALSDSLTVSIRGREMTAELDYRFHRGHIKDADGLWQRLQEPSASATNEISLARKQASLQKPTVGAAKGLAAHLAERLEIDRIESDPGSRLTSGAPSISLESLEEVLNAVLKTRFYDQAQFKHVVFRRMQTIIDLYVNSAETIPVSSPELIQFNRLLLEEIFPSQLEKVSEIRLAAIIARLHEKRQAALCLSGGGTRSGTFALGLLQVLARRDLLSRFDYLSTVSGGGYIGGWLTAWIHRRRGGLQGVVEDLTNTAPASKIDPDPSAIRYLRTYSNFLTPKAGLLSADSWTFLAIYVRNLFLNWSVFVPLLLAAVLVPRFIVALTLAQKDAQLAGLSLNSIGIDFPVAPRHLLLLEGFVLTVLAVTYAGMARPGMSELLKERYPSLARRTDQPGFLLLCLLPLTLAAVCLTTYWAWTEQGNKGFLFFGAFGAAVPILGGIISRCLLRAWPSFGETLSVLCAGIAGGVLVGATARAQSPVVTQIAESWGTELYACLAVPLFLLLFQFGSVLYVGLSSHTKLVNDEDREWWARFNGWFLIVAVGWAAFSALVLFGPLVLFDFPKTIASLGGVSGLVATLLGRSAKTSAGKQQEAKGGILSLVTGQILPLLAFAFLAVFVAALSLSLSALLQALASSLPPPDLDLVSFMPFRDYVAVLTKPLSGDTHLRLVHYSSALWIFVLMTLLTALGLVLARVINLNFFSLHGSYRNRLIRGFLGASREEGARRPNPFTGFDPSDNIYMHELRPALLHEVDFTNLEGLAHRLKNAGEQSGTPSDPTAYIHSRLSQNVKDRLKNYVASVPLSQRMKVELIEDLNRILENDSISLYREKVFEAVWKKQNIQKRTSNVAQREYHIHRNRLVLEEVFHECISPSSYPPHRLFHIVNTTLNLVGGGNLAWQQRKAEPFSVSPLHSGSYRVGYRRSKDYGGDDGISMGTAIAISGAAASSNMGYYTTSPVLSLVLTLFNVRMGWWLGNPGPAGNETYTTIMADGKRLGSKKTYGRASPTYSISPILAEAFGQTNDQNKYVYLTDGGHFENLALYEMVLRRCNLIVLADGAADPKFEFGDLGNAVRKIRIDFGIRIEFDDVPIFGKKPEKEGASYWAIGRIFYSDVDGKNAPDGVLIYIKPAIYFDEPEDVCNYKKDFPDFPHETTADQFFDEPQFESHRALGFHIMDRMCRNIAAASATPGDRNEEAKIEFVKSVKAGLLEMADQMAKYNWKWLDDWLKR